MMHMVVINNSPTPTRNMRPLSIFSFQSFGNIKRNVKIYSDSLQAHVQVHALVPEVPSTVLPQIHIGKFLGSVCY